MAVVCCLHPTGGCGNVLFVHLKYIIGIRVTYVTSLVAAFPDLKQTALQVVLRLAKVLMKALCSESTSDVNTCSDVTSVFVHSKTPLHRRVQASVFWSFSTLHSSAFRVGTSCCHSVHFNCLPFFRRSIWPAVVRSLSHHLNRHKEGSRTSSWWSRPLSMLSSCVAPSSKSCRQIRFFRGPQLQSDAQTTPLSRGVCTSAAPQEQRTKDRQRTATQTRTLSSGTSTLSTHFFLGVLSHNRIEI